MRHRLRSDNAHPSGAEIAGVERGAITATPSPSDARMEADTLAQVAAKPASRMLPVVGHEFCSELEMRCSHARSLFWAAWDEP